jgi:hypothetical protein
VNTIALPAYTQDLSDGFFAELASSYGADAPNLLAVWQSESGLRAAAHNPNGDASGLCQLMPVIAKGLGWDEGDCTNPPRLAHYRSLSAAAQLLPWVERYYAPWKSKLTSPELAYLATFLPAYLERPADELVPSLVIAAKKGPLGWAYEANMTFDPDRAGVITLGDLGAAVARNCHTARYSEAEARLAAALGVAPAAPHPSPLPFDLRTVSGLEEALAALETSAGRPFYVGPIDGEPGRLLHDAVGTFQLAHGLSEDFAVGPVTRAAIAEALDQLPH